MSHIGLQGGGLESPLLLLLRRHVRLGHRLGHAHLVRVRVRVRVGVRVRVRVRVRVTFNPNPNQDGPAIVAVARAEALRWLSPLRLGA